MYRILEFLRRTYVFLLFLLFEGVAFYAYAHSDVYSEAKILSYTSAISGGVGNAVGFVSEYFSLRKENDVLLKRIATLEQDLAHYDAIRQEAELSQLSHDDYDEGICYRASRVVSNTLNKQRNYLVINSGANDGIGIGMAVVTPNREMVGVVVESSDSHSVVMSILNTQFRSSGRLDGGEEHAGSIYWEGEDRYRVKMKDLSKYAAIERGAKIVTTGFSKIFPTGITIGTVSDYELDIDGQSYEVVVDLAADMTALREVLVVCDMANIEIENLLDAELYNPQNE